MNGRRAIILLAALMLGLGCDRADYSPQRLRAEHALLAKQDMAFIKRGRDFGYYDVTVISDRGDTLHCNYRVPAGVLNRKLKALLWLYDSPDTVDMSVLDGTAAGRVTAVLGCNLHDAFERDGSGAVKSGKSNAMSGLLDTRRRVDLLLQLLRKHQVNDSLQIFVGGEGLAAVAAIPALAGQSKRHAGIALADLSGGQALAEQWTEYEFAQAATWSGELRGHVALFDDQDPGIAFAQSPQRWPLSGTSLESVVRWVAGGDTLASQVLVDTTFSRVVKVES